MKAFLEKLSNKQDLTFKESKEAFEILMNGKASDDEIFSFLTLLSAKGEVSNEIAGGVYVLRNKSKRVNVDNCIDTCGTGRWKKYFKYFDSISFIIGKYGYQNC